MQNVRTNEIVKSVEFSNTEFKTYEIVFETQRSDTYYIGIDAGSAKSGSACIDNAKVTTRKPFLFQNILEQTWMMTTLSFG